MIVDREDIVSVAGTAIFDFLAPAVKKDNGLGVHVSMTVPKPGSNSTNFWMDVQTAEKLTKALHECLEYIYQRRLDGPRT